MNYANIKYNDIANGPGTRVSLFVSGCTHHCKNCFNQSAWDFNAGKPFTLDERRQILEYSRQPHVHGLSLLGGEPFELPNQEIAGFLMLYRNTFPDKTIWIWSGYTYEQLTGATAVHTALSDAMLDVADVLVDGEYIEQYHVLELRFRGSFNQRIIDLKKTKEAGNIILWQDEAVFATHKWERE